MQPPQKKTLLQRWKDSIGGWPLLCKIVAWVVLAILAFAAVMCCLWHLTSEPGKCVASIAATSLTIVGGVGAVAYLVIKYQERQQAGRDEERAKREEDREKGRLVNTKMQDAVDQLGSDRASTRIAGVYALTDVADTYGGGYRQRVVDILCGYLRSDRETYPLGADGKPATDQPRSGDSDKAVESTIIAVMRNHLLKERKADNGEIRVRQIVRDDQLWCDCAFDLHGVTFHEYVDLMDITFVRGLNFNRSKFEDHINSKERHSKAMWSSSAQSSKAMQTSVEQPLRVKYTSMKRFSKVKRASTKRYLKETQTSVNRHLKVSQTSAGQPSNTLRTSEGWSSKV